MRVPSLPTGYSCVQIKARGVLESLGFSEETAEETGAIDFSFSFFFFLLSTAVVTAQQLLDTPPAIAKKRSKRKGKYR